MFARRENLGVRDTKPPWSFDQTLYSATTNKKRKKAVWLARLSLHDDTDKPPNIPAFGASTKKPHKESVADAITGAAATVIKALHKPEVNSSNDSKASAEPQSHITPITGISPGKAVELRMKNLNN